MLFFLDYAAHEEHPISHTTTGARVTLSIAFAGGAALATAVTGGGFLAIVFAAGAYGGLGMDIGKVKDEFHGRDPTGVIKGGYPDVLLGPKIKRAARADSADTVTDKCHNARLIAEGSTTVCIGPDFKPMVRRQDRTKCDGIVCDGLHSLLVGGVPSQYGHPIDEEDSAAVKALKGIFGAAGALKAFVGGKWIPGLLKAGATIADVEGDSKTAALLKGATVSKPKTAMDFYSTAKNSVKSMDAATKLLTGGGTTP